MLAWAPSNYSSGQPNEAAGTHRRLAMEVVDDMKLGKIVKQARGPIPSAAQEAVVVAGTPAWGI